MIYSFFISIVLIIISPYIFYLLVLIILNRFSGRRDSYCLENRNLKSKPMISFVLAVYNEEKVIKKKLKNFLELEHPHDKIEVLIGSDNSNDSTNKIIKEFIKNNNLSNFKFYNFCTRSGKTGVLNKLVPKSTGDILFFTDANTFISQNSINEILKEMDKDVGGVGGRIIDSKSGFEEHGFHKKMEQKLKTLESNFYSTISLFGGFYAIRKKLFEIIPSNIIVDDFFITSNILRKGYKLKFSEKATALEANSENSNIEFKRRKRIGKGNYQAMFYYGIKICKDFKINLIYFFHKIIKWITPFLLILLFALNIFIKNTNIYFQITFWGQVLMYTISLYEIFTESEIKFLNNKVLRPFKYIKTFIMMNLAYLLGFFDYLKGVDSAIWERTER